MDIWSIVLGLLGVLGVSNIIGNIINFYLENKKLKFEVIYKKRLEVLVEIYKKLDKTERLFQSLMNFFQGAEEPSEKEKNRSCCQSSQ